MARSNQNTFNRRLAAVMMADVVGYSRLMERDEVGTLRQVRLMQETCIDPITAAHGGKLVKSTGDGFLFEFSSALDAILFAVALQKNLQAMVASAPKAERLVVRIGVHAGDILGSGNDIFGNGVNIAARLETLCTPGAVCMSDIVQQQLHTRIDVPLVDRGEHLVKNITRPIRVYEIGTDVIMSAALIRPEPVPAGTGRRRRGLVAGAFALLALSVCGIWAARLPRFASNIREPAKVRSFSLAVLPFTTLSDDGKPDPFADALVDNLTTDLSIDLPASSVIATASTFTYRGKDVDPRRASRDLDAKYLLTGSVQKAAEHFRVNVHLIDGDSGGQLWSDAFDGSLAEVAALQDQITVGIANTLSLQVVRIEADRQKYTTNVTALDLIFRAIAVATRELTPESAMAAERDLRQALVLDPDNILAMECLANLLLSTATKGAARGIAVDDEIIRQVQDLLARVRTQNPRFPGLHNQLGFLALLFDKPEEAIEHYRTEIRNDPSAASAYAGLGICLIKTGRAQEAVPLIARSIRLDPRNPGIASNYQAMALAYFALKQYSDVVEQADHAYAANPNNAEVLFLSAAADALLGKEDEGRSKLAEARKLDPERTLGGLRRNIRAKEPSNIELTNRFIDGLRRAGLPD